MWQSWMQCKRSMMSTVVMRSSYQKSSLGDVSSGINYTPRIAYLTMCLEGKHLFPTTVSMDLMSTRQSDR